MNQKLAIGALKIAVGLAGSLVIGAVIKGEHRVMDLIKDRWPTEELITKP
jgi:hypothetical protein